MATRLIPIFAALSLTVICACGREDMSATETAAPLASEASAVSAYIEAVQHPGRTKADRARDSGRRPAEVMEFFGIASGMDILDMFSGGGYYTEMLSRIVGSDGSVVAHSNQAYAQFVGKETTNRYGNAPYLVKVERDPSPRRGDDRSWDGVGVFHRFSASGGGVSSAIRGCS